MMATDRLPTSADIEKRLSEVRMNISHETLSWRYIVDDNGEPMCIEVSDGKGFVSYMNEEVFKKFGLDKTAKAGPRK